MGHTKLATALNSEPTVKISWIMSSMHSKPLSPRPALITALELIGTRWPEQNFCYKTMYRVELVTEGDGKVDIVSLAGDLGEGVIWSVERKATGIGTIGSCTIASVEVTKTGGDREGMGWDQGDISA